MKNPFDFFKKKKNFLSILKDYIDKIITEDNLSLGTTKKYNTFYSNISRFLFSVNMQEVPPNLFKIKLAEDLKLHLHKTLPSCGKSHSARHIELCKRALGYAVIQEYIELNPLAEIKLKRSPLKEIIAIDLEAIIKLQEYNFQAEILRRTADLYLFQCYTGLSYGDLYSFRIIKDSDGLEWFCNQRQKSNVPYWIPVFNTSRQIYDKYNGKLPRFANGTYNRLIKEIAALTGIGQHLTSHTARKTFATLKSDSGYSTETISQMLGQKSVKTTERHYISVNKKRIILEVLRNTGS